MPPAGEAFLAQEPQLRRAIHDLVAKFSGSFSAEHGIGRLKRDELARYASPVALGAMRAIKHGARSQRHHEPWQAALTCSPRMAASRCAPGPA